MSEEIDNDNVDDFQGHTLTNRATSESEESPTPTPPRRSVRQRVMTPKAQFSTATSRKGTAEFSKGEMKDAKHREIDNRAQTYWIARVRLFGFFHSFSDQFSIVQPL